MPSVITVCRHAGWAAGCVILAAFACVGYAQNAPIAIVPVEGVQLTGAMDVAQGKAVIAASGTVTAGERPVSITLPHRGNLRLCSTTKVTLTADASTGPAATTSPATVRPVASESGSMPTASGTAMPAGDPPGLMMALDRGALETNFATQKNSDIILTPDFRIVISGPGSSAVQVRLGDKGDTCVDNHGVNPPYVLVTSVFDGNVYRVQSNQRVMFQHGSLNEVIDSEKESCGCPPEEPPSSNDNAFPVAQSAGLQPLPTSPPNVGPPGTVNAQVTAQLSYNGRQPGEIQATVQPAESVAATPAPPPSKPKTGFLANIGHFFRKIFGG
jgi:hypothetical protein